jgi:hypothetical protein
MSYGGTREQGFQGEQMQRSENASPIKDDGKWKAKYGEFIQKVPCKITMKLAWAFQVLAILQWLLLSESRVVAIATQTDKSLLLAPYLEGVYAFVVFPMLYVHLSGSVEKVKTIQARAKYSLIA